MEGRYILFFGFILIKSSLFAQRIDPFDAENIFLARIISIEDFIHRFNYWDAKEPNWQLQSTPTDNHRQKLIERKKSLASLFDQDAIQAKEGQELRQLASEFIHEICTRAEFIDFLNQDWYALITVKGTYLSHPTDFRLLLQTQALPNSMVQWRLVEVFSESFRSRAQAWNSTYAFPPNSHGSDFISLPRQLKAQITSSATSDSLAKEITGGRLNMESVIDVTYHFLQIEGWYLTVTEYN